MLPPASKRRLFTKSLTIIGLPALIGFTLLIGLASYSNAVPVDFVITTKERLHADLDAIHANLISLKDGRFSSNGLSPMEAGIQDASPAQDNTIQISVLPRPRAPSLQDQDEKYLGYLPHSGEESCLNLAASTHNQCLCARLPGYHNQRIELVQAIMLAKMLNRTL